MTGGTIASMAGVTHRYGKTLALDNITLDFPAGKMLGLIGPDGVGKSTLLGLLAGSRKMQDGTVEVLGGSMAGRTHRNAVCQRIAYMPQGLGKNLYADLSVLENLDFFGKLFGQPKAERRARVGRLAKATGLDPFLDRPAGKLSGGMKQKLGLCCALIHDPDFLILDEPTTGVDPLSRRQFWDLIDSIRTERAGMSVLVSTAYMEEASRFDWLTAMDAGRILFTGTPAALRGKTGAQDLEAAFAALLPAGRSRSELVIPPRAAVDGEPAIVARNLTRQFGDFTAVDDVSFEIERGEIYGFLGSNGCGKTTTMKMLTGLLPASKGEARLFGQPADANDIETRKRVGFMSQSFSLYGELTVMQNLNMHARLFHMKPDLITTRTGELLKDFGLAEYRDALAGSLPLGLRQRLSLAVAIIHQPEMLILDEPTSGVDPIARDDFWRLLIGLSRRDQVTIFISTHFMNEAMRCDRISLMHAGRVLVQDTPQSLSHARGAKSLEDAFVIYIQEAIGETGKIATAGAAALTAPPALPQNATVAPGLMRLMAFASREAIEVLRDPVRLAFAFFGSVFLFLMFAVGLSFDVDNLKFAAFDQDRTPESRSFLANFEGSRYFIERPEVQSLSQLENRLKAGDIALAIEIPAGFGKAVVSGGNTQVSAWIDGADPGRAATIEGYVQGAYGTFLHEQKLMTGTPEMPPLTHLQMRYRYNPSFQSIYAMAPSVPAILLFLFPAILMSVSVAREREIGTITNFYVTPTRRLEFLVGKQLPYVAISLLNFLLMTALGVFLFGVSLQGSFFALSVGALAYVLATTGFGLVVSTFTKSQVAAVFATAVLGMMPTVQFSGLVQPVSTLEGAARIIGSLWPTTYYMHMSVGAFTKGLTFAELGPDILATAAFIPVFILIASALLKKQEK